MQIDKTVQSPASPAETFAFLADFTTTEQWDPGTERTERVSGDGGVGTVYRNTSRFLGRSTELSYVVREYQPDTRVVLRGENKSVIAHDTMTVTPAAGGGATVRYQARFDLKGLARLAAPLFVPAFARLGNAGADQLQRTLNRLGSR
ncbi:SRPBCC family protein [Mycolicibacterium brumae]|uniref:Polyketide cyclase n=1 Tax=Mycolicibacterium brumae TaxID=85968 RepID=A0A2G5PA32_9MYCO|nr:SRPBCC family protein [Mycolicibacterium brumae]MCV7192933.1 SRPBCC family protein [Mycolicibacterium brumae]PIB75229.1 polyketide cyclase [Mycolicibacterium brumae]RWA23522.1 hypothetical protein MBRU_01475 [Mycolicibacterium brumae DSM 44177]UWW08548.1 SRPBCC family protein [Mycolicibacterium brumae]